MGILCAFFQRALEIWFSYLKIRKYRHCYSHLDQHIYEINGRKLWPKVSKYKAQTKNHAINVDSCYCDQFRMTYLLAVYCPIELHQNRNTFCHINYRHSQIRSFFYGWGQFWGIHWQALLILLYSITHYSKEVNSSLFSIAFIKEGKPSWHLIDVLQNYSRIFAIFFSFCRFFTCYFWLLHFSVAFSIKMWNLGKNAGAFPLKELNK